MPKKPRTDRLQPELFNAKMDKPQESFRRPTNNFAEGPWKPLLSQKPHATVPLEQSLGTVVDENQNEQYDRLSYLPLTLVSARSLGAQSLSERQEALKRAKKRQRQKAVSRRETNGRFRYKHPYEFEILNLKYPEFVYQTRDPIPYTPMESTAAVWVDTLEGVKLMLTELKKAQEIAIDLEHHDRRTYHGLLSLMQISTRNQDWVIDTLKPWRHELEILNEVFADPRIVKVFHGAFMDIVWLQRDLGLYVVGMFDTFHACEALEFPQKSLAYLLKSYVNFDADKKYQLADWRIR